MGASNESKDKEPPEKKMVSLSEWKKELDELDNSIFTQRHLKRVRKTDPYKRIREIQRKGLPLTHQLALWERTVQAINPDTKERIEQYSHFFDDIHHDEYCNITFGCITYLQEDLDVEQKAGAKRAMQVLAYNHDNITYCPMLPTAVALFFKLGLTEEQVFNLTDTMVKTEDAWHFRTNARQFLKDVKLGCFLCPKAIKAHVQANQIDLHGLVQKWLNNFFKDLFPEGFRMKMFQIWAFEGYKIKFRILKNLFVRHQSRLLEAKSTEMFEANMKKGILDKFERKGTHTTMKRIFGANMGRKLSRKKLLGKMEQEQELLSIPAPQFSQDTEKKLDNESNEMNDEDWVILEKSMHALDKKESENIPAKICTLSLPDFENGQSGILSKRDLFVLWSKLPCEAQMYQLSKIFSASRQGYSLIGARKAILNPPDDFSGRVLVVIISKENDIFGCYLSGIDSAFKRSGLLKNSDTRIFSIAKGGDTKDLPAVWSWDEYGLDPRASRPMVKWDKKKFSVGCETSTSIQFDSALENGLSLPSEEMGAPKLVKHELGSFQITDMEIWALTLGIGGKERLDLGRLPQTAHEVS